MVFFKNQILFLYELGINESILYQNPKRELNRLSSQITLYVKNHLDEFFVSDLIFIKEPLPCCFRRLPESERDDIVSKSGLRLSGSVTNGINFQEMIEAEPIIAKELARQLDATEKKFKEYTDCVKILILEICGDFLSIPAPDTIIKIIENSNIPPIVDQIWLADPEDESENIITYHRVV